jgi:hypothetical protein
MQKIRQPIKHILFMSGEIQKVFLFFFLFFRVEEMPTTRFASTQNPEETTANETVQEIRNKRFSSRKKREGYTAQTPKQRVMMQFLSTIIE